MGEEGDGKGRRRGELYEEKRRIIGGEEENYRRR